MSKGDWNVLLEEFVAEPARTNIDQGWYHSERLDVLLHAADVVVLCCPLKPETTGLIGAAELKRMRSSAYLINVARGPVVVESELIAALHEGEIAGAALDVTIDEPLAPDSPLWAMKWFERLMEV